MATATSPTPALSCIYVSEWTGNAFVDRSRCSGWAEWLGAVPLNGAAGTPTSINLTFATSIPAGQLTGNISNARLNSGTSADSTHFWRGDGVWAVPPVGESGGTPATPGGTGGDLQVNDGASGFGGITPGTGVAAWLAAPTSANLATATAAKTGTGNLVFATSPALVTPTLGTPASVNLANATNIPAGQLTGNIANARLNGGASASSTTFWRGDGTWAVPAGGGGTATPGGISGDLQTNNGAGGFNGITPGAGIASWLAVPSSANLLTALTTKTGTGTVVFSTSPTLITPTLGTPASVNLANATNIPAGQLTGTISTARFNSGTGADTGHFLRGDGTWAVPPTGSGGGGTATPGGAIGALQTNDGAGGFGGIAPGAGIAAWLAIPTSANLLAAMTTDTGTGNLVFATSPTLVTPVLGTPASVNLLNATNIPAGQLTGTVATARFNSGTNADATHFLRGDGTWATTLTVTDGTRSGAATSLSLDPKVLVVDATTSPTIVISNTVTVSTNRSAANYTLLAADNNTIVPIGSAHTYTVPQAGTTGFGPGAGPCLLNVSTSGNATVTSTTSVFLGAGNTTSFSLPAKGTACLTSAGGDWITVAHSGIP